MRRIGICRALDGLRFLDVWEPFLAGLGFDVVVSRPTDRAMIEAGAALAPGELCLPAKVFLGHARSLATEVDLLFVPRLVCRRLTGADGRQDLFFGCPKAMALPDMVRALLPDLPPMVEFVLDERERSEDEAYRQVAKRLGRGQGRSQKSQVTGHRSQVGCQKLDVTGRMTDDRGQMSDGRCKTDEGGCQEGGSTSYAREPLNPRTHEPSSSFRVGVVGHGYLVDDVTLSVGLLDKLRATGAEPVRDSTAPPLSGPAFVPNWMFEKELIERALRLAGDETVGGLVLATSFACGTSAVTNELIRRAVAHSRPGLPVLTVMFDEHTAEAGLVTRLESFLDLILMRGTRARGVTG